MGQPPRGVKGRFTSQSLSTTSDTATGSISKRTKRGPKKGKKQRNKRSLPCPSINHTPRTGKKTSLVWFYFKQVSSDRGFSEVDCLICGNTFKNPGGSTTGMRSHLDRKHLGCIEVVENEPEVARKVQRAKDYIVTNATIPVEQDFTLEMEYLGTQSPPPPRPSMVRPPSPNSSVSSVTFMENGVKGEVVGETEISEVEDSVDVGSGNEESLPEVYTDVESYEEASKGIIHYLAINLQPVKTVIEPGLQRMLRSLHPLYLMRILNDDDASSVPRVLISSISSIYAENCEELKLELEEKYISINLELWPKTNSEIYVLASANYISDEWKFASRFMGMAQLPETNLMTPTNELYDKITLVLNGLLEELNVNRDKLITMTINASPFKQEGPSTISSLVAIPCFNEVLRQAFNILDDYANKFSSGDLTQDCQKLAKRVLPSYKEVKNHPGKLMESFENYLRMTGSASGGGNLSLNKTTISIKEVETLVNMQKPINEFIEALLEEQQIPASTLLLFISGIQELYSSQLEREHDSTWTPEQKRQVAVVINNYIQSAYNIDLASEDIGDKTLATCSFLDPRCKNKFFTEKQNQIVYDDILEMMHQIEKEKHFKYDIGSTISVCSQSGGSCDRDPLSFSIPQPSTSKFATMFSKLMGRNPILSTSSNNVQLEMSKYYQQPVVASHIDPYVWWSYNYENYPTLAELAKKFLCIRGLSISTKRAFTSDGKEYYNRLASVEPDYLEKLLFIHKNVPVETDALSDSAISQSVSVCF